jgi:type II secretory pathway pseudopilin PulG
MQNTRGFTLIAVLIAISILSMLMVGIISFTQSAQDTAERVTREDKELLQIETAMSRVQWDFSQIYSPLYFSHQMDPEGMTEDEGEIYNQIIDSYQQNDNFTLLSYDGLPIPLFKTPDKSTLIFYTSSNRRKFENIKQSNFAWVKYSLEADESSTKDDDKEQKTTKEVQKSMMLVRNLYTKDIYNSEKIQWDNVKTQILLRKVIKVVFEFWNPATFKWTENLDIIKNGYHIIYALRMTIEFYDADNLEKVSVRVFRPSFPEFKPEDMYKYLNEKIEPTEESGEGSGSDSSSSQAGSSEGGGQDQ